jgi:hypothetical protein
MPDEGTPLIDNSNKDNNLAKFRKAIGINIHATDDGDLEAARKGAIGLYKEIISIQRRRGRQYRFVETIFYLVLGAQILIGASLASLGSLSAFHPTSITILGIVSTSIAGLLAIFKGQNLPDRLRKDQYQMKKVQEFIEETEIRLSMETDDEFTAQELDELVQKVFEKYNTAIDTAEMNRPSSYAHQNEAVIKKRDGGGNFLMPRSSAGEDEIGNGTGKGKGKLIIE